MIYADVFLWVVTIRFQTINNKLIDNFDDKIKKALSAAAFCLFVLCLPVPQEQKVTESCNLVCKVVMISETGHAIFKSVGQK